MIGVIVGSGFEDLRLEHCLDRVFQTPFGEVELTTGQWANQKVALVYRHGKDHRYAPHQVPYRAQIWALKSLGVSHILATGTVGGMSADNAPGHMSVPDQIVDYTWGRESTYWGVEGFKCQHIDFTEPFSSLLREALLESAKALKIYVHNGGVYACTQGPRLETAAEVRRMIMDGCDMCGMTAMPEAALARELGMEYAMLCASVNWAAGLSGSTIAWDDVKQTMANVVVNMKKILNDTISHLNV